MTSLADWRVRYADLDPRDVDVLAGHVLGRNRAFLIAHPDFKPPRAASDRFFELADRRRAGEPVAYLTGTQAFWTLTLSVTRDVLIPRPETELLVELALARIAPGARVLDLGTGSGAVAICLADVADVTATDVSAAALDVARANARNTGAAVRFVLSDWFGSIDERFDLIVSNPPYVASNDEHLPALRYEPRAALAAGSDGLDALRTICAQAPQYLADGGWLLVEHGCDQSDAVQQLCRTARLVGVETFPDLAGLPRVTVARTPV